MSVPRRTNFVLELDPMMRKLEVRIQIVFEVEIHKHTDKYMKALMHMFYYISNIASKEK